MGPVVARPSRFMVSFALATMLVHTLERLIKISEMVYAKMQILSHN